MTNYIEQLMKAAGVVPVHLTDCIFINIRKGYDVGTDCCPGVEDERLKCEDCEHSKETQLIYPAFTPAKQLELIKLILKADNVDSLCQCYHKAAHMFIFECFMIYEFKNQVKFSSQSNHCYEQALADLILTLIGKNELNKSKVKRILEDD